MINPKDICLVAAAVAAFPASHALGQPALVSDKQCAQWAEWRRCTAHCGTVMLTFGNVWLVLCGVCCVTRSTVLCLGVRVSVCHCVRVCMCACVRVRDRANTVLCTRPGRLPRCCSSSRAHQTPSGGSAQRSSTSRTQQRYTCVTLANDFG